jgi:hypothetical protein
MMEAVRTSETSVYSETTLHYIPDGCNLHTRCCENRKSHACTYYYGNNPWERKMGERRVKNSTEAWESFEVLSILCDGYIIGN